MKRKAKALVSHLSERQYPDCYVSLFKSECERLVSQLVSHIVLRQPFPPMFHDKRQIITNSQEKISDSCKCFMVCQC